MTEQIADMPQFDDAGQTAVPETDNSVSSQDETNTGDNTQSVDGEETNNQHESEDNLPFHEHPRWKEREDEWNSRFNDQEKRHQDDLKALREEFSANKGEQPVEVPEWFGGSQEQWQKFQEWNNSLVQKAEQSALEKLQKQSFAQEQAVKEATKYMESEINSIQNDKDLNPDGAKIDQNKLLKIVMDNDLIDSKGRWNYRAGWKIYSATMKSGPDTKTRKTIAGATTSSPSKGEKLQPQFKTSENFKKNRPW